MKSKARKQLRKIVKVAGYRFAPNLNHFAKNHLNINTQTVIEKKDGALRLILRRIEGGKEAQLGYLNKRCLKTFADGYAAAIREFISLVEKE